MSMGQAQQQHHCSSVCCYGIGNTSLQVRNLYGPLLACVTASKSAFDAMCRQHSPDGTPKTFIAAIRGDPAGREGQIYR